MFDQLSGVIDPALTRALDRSNNSVASHLESVEVHGRLFEALRLRDGKRVRPASKQMLQTAARDLKLLASARRRSEAQAGHRLLANLLSMLRQQGRGR